jgi:hypothetical protein
MVTILAAGDRIHVGDSVTLTLLSIQGKLVHLEVESSERGDRGLRILIEGRCKADLSWWELN